MHQCRRSIDTRTVITTTFLNLDLIDEYRLAIHPVKLGEGKSLFQSIENSHKLNLVDSKSYKSGVILLRYNADRTMNRKA